jgi:hypothetical protein
MPERGYSTSGRTKWESHSALCPRLLTVEAQMNGNLRNIWLLGADHTVLYLVLLQGIDLALTLIHSLQERKGRLWRYFGAIAGVKIPDTCGQLVFFGGLTVSLWIVGLIGITYAVIGQTPFAFVCLGAIVGCRASDSLFSHILLYNAGFRPNPGLPSVPLYLAETLVLSIIFWPAIVGNILLATIGFIIGTLAFYAVVPVLRRYGPLILEPIEAWHAGRPQPTSCG